MIEELRRIARLVASSKQPGTTLQPTALVNELYLRLRQRRTVAWTSRAQFFGFAAQAMRRILIDAARSRRRQKRGGGAGAVDLDELTSSLGLPARDPVDFLALDTALVRLEALDARQVRVVELRFFAGLPMEQVAEALGISRATAQRDWSTARVWLFRELSARPSGPGPGTGPGPDRGPEPE